MASYKIALIPGDGIGVEVADAARFVFDKLGENFNLNFNFITCEAGLDAWKNYGSQVPDETLEIIRETKIAYYGAATTLPGPKTPKSVAVTLRQAFDLYANVRPARSRAGVPNPLNRYDIDLVVVRENTEGLYSGLEMKLTDEVSIGINKITKKGSKRVAEYAFNLAGDRRKKVTAAHKANILKESHGLFRMVCEDVSKNYPGIEFNDIFADALAMDLLRRPETYDVIVATNLIGDIISDECSAIVGGLGLAPSANIGENYALFEPVHGSAPDIAGRGIANPVAMILSGAMMLEHLKEHKVAGALRQAVDDMLLEGKVLTPDLGGSAKTMDVAGEICRKLAEAAEGNGG